MRKTLLYIIALAILGFGVWYFLFQDRDLFGADEAGFNVKNTDAIEQIYMANRKGDNVLLQKTDDGWTVNNKYKARQGMMNILLETIRYQEASYPVPENAHNNVITSLSTNAIKVELYGKDKKEIRTFYVGGQVHNNAGTYMMVEGAKKPYVVQLPVFQGYVTPRYNVYEDDWRSRNIVALTKEELERFTINYPEGEELNDFTLLKKDDGTFTVDVHEGLSSGKELNQRRVKTFVGFFENINCEGFLNGTLHMDSIIANADKKCAMDITGENTKQHIDVYWMPVNKRSKNITTPDPDVPDDYDADRYYAVFNQYKDTAIIQRLTFDKLFRKGYEFYEEDEQ